MMMTLFKRKKPSAPEPIALPVLNNDLQRKLEMEIRTCATCSYTITNPMNDRCPRCFAVVPLSEHTNCGECTQQGNCAHQQGE